MIVSWGSSDYWKLENPVLSINEQMKELEYEVFRDEHPLTISLDWLAVNGNLVASAANKQTLTLSDLVKPSLRNQDQRPRNDGVLLLKEAQPNILSKEADKFLNSFFRILKDNLDLPPGTPGSKPRENFNRFVKGRFAFTKCWM